MNKNNLREINPKLITAFKATELYQMVMNPDSGLMAFIRNNAIRIYYNSDRVSMVRFDKRRELICDVNNYYLDNGRTGDARVSCDELVSNIDIIKKKSKDRSTPEKKSQHSLVRDNNRFNDSEWFCFDIEYRQSTKIQGSTGNLFTGRFDILAVSKTAPYRLAIIELKYNDDAIGGKSGIVKHIKDFVDFKDNQICFENLKKECVSIIQNYEDLEIPVPKQLHGLRASGWTNTPEFFVISLYEETSTRGTMGGYLFQNLRENWGTKKISSKNAQKILGIDVEAEDSPIKVKFLFKKVDSPQSPNINDILNSTEYE